MNDIEVRTWPDGHGLYQDQWQWIVQHGKACREKGRRVFLRQPENVLSELAQCGTRVTLEALTEVPGGPGRA